VKNDMKDRALVLGGGGVAGIAWTTGLLFGLSEHGVDLRTAGLIVGTSAGSAVAAQLGSALSPSDLFNRQVEPAQQTRELAPNAQLFELFERALLTANSARNRGEHIRHIGRWALEAPTVTEAERRSVIAERLPSHIWPNSTLLIVAVDTETGETKIFDRLCGTSLVDAVSASCAVPGIWPPVTINGRRYMDGGARSSDNADLALGYARTVIVSPMGTARPEVTGVSLEQQIETLESAGGKTYLVEPDELSKSAIGLNPLAPETRVPAARAGRNQGHAIAEDVACFWSPSK
jgi:NTE family protein